MLYTQTENTVLWSVLMVALDYFDMAGDVNSSSTCGEKKDTLMSSNAARSSFSYGGDIFSLKASTFLGGSLSLSLSISFLFFFFFLFFLYDGLLFVGA